MAKHIVTCRVCKEKFDTNEVEWIMPSKNFYYHKSCYEDWQVKKNDVRNNSKDEDLWKDATYQYLKKDLYIPVDFGKFDSQWCNLFENGEKRALNVINGLFIEAQMNEDFKYLLIRRKDNIPTMLIDMIGA